ncbi:glycine cleavage system H-protein subunit [Coemansia erecta]|uniref:Glycine cleavage system H protein n=1 Tax=Coemansia asiatica TaxID=1052880 RepID=A0A9W7XIM9_9FUNG|nr:glycine cleavage system H-protein subunit [Coemansia asiatica]KAJ2856060.1 glycine cleavage system H-protein subunit [Coemansia erecta]KAJ2875801.1 glycine cleavage system H-protein subunit [Coemansia asiatica]
MSLRLLSKSFVAQRITPTLSSRFYATKKYTASHEWISIDNGVGTVGITEYAQNALGDVVYVEVPEVGSQVELDETVGVVESVKSTSDIYSPLSGEIVDANKDVVEKSKLINQSPEKDGWLFKVKFSSQEEVDNLLDEAAYKKLTESEN